MTAKIVLDCESFETALESLARIFQTTQDKMKALLSVKEIRFHYQTHGQSFPGDFGEYVYAIVEKHFGSPLILDAVCWFHTTRILPGTTFSEGILPLGAALPSLEERLIEAVDDINVRQQFRNAIQSGGAGDHHYIYKTQDSLHWGPYGILVRDVAFHATRLCQHDYLNMPEIIEDICNGFEETTGISLIDEFSQKLRPAIVKFTSTANHDESCIASALCYVFSMIHEGAPSSNSVNCFDGENTPVPPQDILKVDVLDTSLAEA